jgi:ABC-type Fe3+/spermidine/putrescine transport system ATPase subunit
MNHRNHGAQDAADGDPDAVVRLISVSKHFGQVKAVDELSLEVKQGEILTLLGPSGCGKTSTLRMVLGLEKCTSGAIYHRGRFVDDPQQRIFVPVHKRNMGMVFQSYAIWPHMTVAENVAYGLRIRGEKGEQLRTSVRRGLDLVGLSGFEDRLATQLSGGQQQRVALARSLVVQPDLLLLDEPFSNLDAKLREQMRGELKVLQRRLGMTVLFVTHDQIEALSLSDRVAVMHNGKIEQVGSPEDLYRSPSTPRVRDFLGKIVIVEGTVARKHGSGEIVATLVKDPNREIRVRHMVGDFAVGQRCFLALRPEQALVEAGIPDGQSAENNALSGIIEAMLFMGDRYEARVQLPWQQSIEITLPPENAPAEGATIRIVLPDDKIQAWPA